MKTIKLFQEDVYMQSCTASVTDIRVSDDSVLAVLDQTVFFPTGGGQSCDTGKINEFDVTEVFEKDDIVFHRLAADPKDCNLKPGAQVQCTIDWNRRFDNMQRHCGEHILSGMFYREYGGVNRGFHMGEDYMTVDISLEENPEFTEVTWDMAMHAENCTNEAIWQNLPVTVRRFAKREEAENLPLRKALAIDEEISIVCVGSEENPSDCVACCGTHPSTSGQVGLLKIFKVEINKGMFRIYFESGKRAMSDYDLKHRLITELGNKYSAGTSDLMDKIRIRDEKIQSTKNELYILKQSVIKSRSEEILNDLNKEKADIPVYEYTDLKTNDLLNIGRPLIPHIKKLLLLIAPDNTLLLFSNGTVPCGALVKDNAHIYNGKGGGNDKSARALFPKREYLDTFIELLNVLMKAGK